MIKQFSYSQLNQFIMCQKAYEFRYIDRIKTPVKGDMIRGDAYHKAIAHAYSNLIIYKELPSIDEVVQVYTDTWNKRVGDKIIIDEGEEIHVPSVDFRGKDPGKMKDEAEVLLRIYYNTIIPTIIPVEVEVRKTAIYGDIPLVSYIDLIDLGGIVVEHKLKARMFSEAELTKDLQSSFYGLVLGVDELEFRFHAAIAVKEPYVKPIPIHRTKDDIDWVGKLTMAAWRQIQTGCFATTGISGWQCSPAECPFWGYCRTPSWF